MAAGALQETAVLPDWVCAPAGEIPVVGDKAKEVPVAYEVLAVMAGHVMSVVLMTFAIAVIVALGQVLWIAAKSAGIAGLKLCLPPGPKRYWAMLSPPAPPHWGRV